jgi:flagellar motor switch/type III secretory pathway protein FliN
VATLFAAPAGWQEWIAEGLASLLETPAGFAIRIVQRHTVDPQHGEAVFTSESGELTLGRDESCDVRLAPRSVGGRHARLFTQSGRCYIEDLGGAVGTFLNDTRLSSNQPAAVTSGDRFTIFPYAFTIELTERWVRGGPVAVHAGPVLPRHPHLLERPSPVDRTVFTLEVQPIGAEFLLEATPGFLERLSAQVLAPLSPGTAARLRLGAADAGLFELLAAAVLERVNRDLRFPLQARLAPAAGAPVGEDGGIAFSFAIRVAELTGTFRLMFGDRAIQSLLAAAPPAPACAPPGVSWKFPVSAGSVELSHAELGFIEPSDVVLLVREPVILFANWPERGWHLRTRPGNLSQAAIEKYFERPCLSDREPQPDFSSLPVRLHAIIGEKEMTLAEATGLVPGTILELDAARSEPVRIALNGKVAGSGELVEVDGRLGIRILSWRAASS